MIEFFLIFGGSCLAWWTLLLVLEKPGGNASASGNAPMAGNPLVFQLSESKKTFDSKELSVLEFKLLSGVICRYHLDDGIVFARVTLVAKDSSGKIFPVGTSIDSASDDDGFFSRIFEFPLPHEFNTLKCELPILTVPKAALHFPFKGRIRLSAKLTISEIQIIRKRARTIAAAEAELTIFSDEPGYVDRAENAETTAETAVKLATLLASVDGHADSREADIIKKYITLKVAHKGGHNESLKKRLNNAVKETYVLARSQIAATKRELCLKCVNFPLGHKLEIIELLLQVTRADGVAKKDEITMLDEIVREMQIDFNEYKKLRDKMISLEIYDRQEGEINPRSLLGIRDDMSTEEIQKLLNREYRKWNSLQNSSDAAIKIQAQKIIRLIAEEKSKLRKK